MTPPKLTGDTPIVYVFHPVNVGLAEALRYELYASVAYDVKSRTCKRKMTDAIKEFIVELFGANAWLGIVVIAMIPLIELRGAIPFALGSAWGIHKLTWYEAYSSSVIGATIPALVIIPLLIPVFSTVYKQ